MKIAVFAVQMLFLFISIIECLKIMKTREIRQKVAGIFCILLFATLSLQFSKTFVGINDEITLIAKDEKCEESRGTEIDILNLEIDGSVQTSFSVKNGHWYWINWSHDRYAWRPAKDNRWDGSATEQITLKVPVGTERSIRFLSNPWKGYVEIIRMDGRKESINTYSSQSFPLSVSIGKSDAKLLLLDAYLQIIVYGICFEVLKFIFLKMIQKKEIQMKEKNKFENNETGNIMVLLSPKSDWKGLVLYTGVISPLLILFVISNLWGRINENAQIVQAEPEFLSDPITESDCYVQTFTASGKFNIIQLKLSVPENNNEDVVEIQLIDYRDNCLLENWEVRYAEVTDDTVSLELFQGADKGEYSLTIKGDGIGIYLENDASYAGDLYLNLEQQDSDISMGLVKKTKLGYVLLICLLGASLVCAGITFTMLFIWKVSLWKSSFTLIAAFGMIYIFLFPFCTVNDTTRHFITVYGYSNDIMGIPRSEFGNVVMRIDDLEVYNRTNSLSRQPCVSKYYGEFDEWSLLCYDPSLEDCGSQGLINDKGDLVSIISYLPEIIGMTIGRFFSLGTLPCIYFARILELLSVSALVALSVKIIPVGKEILLAIALLPIFLQQITAFSYDGCAFGFAFLFISICTKLKFETEQISLLDFAILVGSTIGLCACRGGMYIFLLLILLLIPKQVFNRFSKGYIFGIGVFTLLAYYGKTYSFASDNASNKADLIFGSPFRHPIRVALHFLSTLIESMDKYWSGSFGGQMGWSENIIPSFLVAGFMLIILIISLSEENANNNIDVKNRICYLIPVVLVVAFCLFTMYLAENEHATEWNIWGVQGRYFIPIMPLIFFQVQNRIIVLKRNIRPLMLFLFCNWNVLEIYYLLRTYLIR